MENQTNLREEMQSLLNNTVIDEMLAPTIEFFTASSYARILNAPVYIWAETELPIFVRLFKTSGMRVQKVVTLERKEFTHIDDIAIVPPQEIFENPEPNRFFFLNETDYDRDTVYRIYSALERSGARYIYVMTSDDRTSLIAHPAAPFDFNRIEYYQAHKAELMQLFDQLEDEKSKQILVDYMRSYMTNSTYRGEQTATRYKYFFGSKDELLYEHLPDECWINCGAATGDTIFSFLGWGFGAETIYAFEGSPNEYRKLLRNLSLLPAEKRAMIKPINAMITNATDFDSILNTGGGGEKNARCLMPTLRAAS